MTTLSELAKQAGVEFVTGRMYFTQEHRNCHAMEKFCVAINAHLDQDIKQSTANSDFIAKLEREKSKLANENSKLAAELTVAIKEKAAAEKMTIQRGLEATDLPEVTRVRIMSTSNNGS